MSNFEFININLEKVDNHFDYFTFLKIYNKSSLDNIKIKNISNNGTLQSIFPFWNTPNNHAKEYKNLTLKDFPLSWLKKQKKVWSINTENIKKISNIDIEQYIKTSIPGSFSINYVFTLNAPYYSSDDDDFYLIQNPCLKENVFKVPMVRGSGWKGAIAKAGKELINENLSEFESFVRIFGTGSQEYRELIDNFENKDIKDKIIRYVLFELGLNLNQEDIKKIRKEPKEYLKKLSGNFSKEKIKQTPFLQTHKGRAIFYPTYFDRLSLEIINPHNRKTGAGTNPIHYEVVPKNTKGELQIVYIPFDGVLMKEEELKKQVKTDLEFLIRCIGKTAENGIGAKTKLGWGRFNLKTYCINGKIENLTIDNREKCEVNNDGQ